MRHVLVETNWVVEVAAPAHLREPKAVQLYGKAERGEIQLHLPAVSLTEARSPIRKISNHRATADSLRLYLKWAKSERKVESARVEEMLELLDQYESAMESELSQMDERLRSLRQHPGIEVFPLTDAMLSRAVELATLNLDLKPFDQAILAAVLVRAESLREAGENDVVFCERDWDLKPWDRSAQVKQPLKGLYDSAHVWVYGDFAMTEPPRPKDFGR